MLGCLPQKKDPEQERFDRAIAHFEKGEFQAAIALLTELRSQHPREYAYTKYLAQAYVAETGFNSIEFLGTLTQLQAGAWSELPPEDQLMTGINTISIFNVERPENLHAAWKLFEGLALEEIRETDVYSSFVYFLAIDALFHLKQLITSVLIRLEEIGREAAANPVTLLHEISQMQNDPHAINLADRLDRIAINIEPLPSKMQKAVEKFFGKGLLKLKLNASTYQWNYEDKNTPAASFVNGFVADQQLKALAKLDQNQRFKSKLSKRDHRLVQDVLTHKRPVEQLKLAGASTALPVIDPKRTEVDAGGRIPFVPGQPRVKESL